MAPAVELTEVDEMAKRTKKISDMNKEELQVRLSEETNETVKELLQLRLDEMSDDDDDSNDDDDANEDDDADDQKGPENSTAQTWQENPKKAQPLQEHNLDELTGKHAKLIDKVAGMCRPRAIKSLAENNFNKLLADGKVVEAQRKPFMENDTIKFAELTQPVKFKTLGAHGEEIAKTETSAQKKF